MLIYQGLLAVTIGLQPGCKGLQGVTKYFHSVQGLKGIGRLKPKNLFKRVAERNKINKIQSFDLFFVNRQ